jgi:hypothetical protein
MRESQYVDDYLDTTARAGPLNGIAVSSYLNRVLRGRAKRYTGSYSNALHRALYRRVADGEVIRLPSMDGGTAYHRIADIRWPITVPLNKWLEAQTACVPIEIHCSHHLRRHEIGFMSWWEIEAVLALTDPLHRTMQTRAITLQCPQGPGDPSSTLFASLLLEAARALAAQPDEPVSRSVSLADVRRPLGLAAALLHAQDCLQAEAIVRAVTAEIRATGRVVHALRSAADPAWVALRALETA